MKRIYFQNLDGLRFFAFLAVFFAHSFWTEFDYINDTREFIFLKEFAYKGVLGVNFFFVLSGFLITYLLIEERENTGSINIKAFYVRRVLKIWPLYYFVVFIGFYAIPFVQSALGQPTPEKGNILYYLFFLGNFDIKPTSAVLGILWSISVEEQFYLVWPILFVAVPRKINYILFPVIILISIPMQFIDYDPKGSLLYSSPFVCMADLALGGWCAHGVFYSDKIRNYLFKLEKYKIVILYILGFVFVISMYRLGDALLIFSIFNRFILSLFFAFIILEQNYCVNSFYKVSSFKNISKLGIYTYSLYMLHFMCIYVVNKALDIFKLNVTIYQVVFLQTGISFVISIVVGWTSYNYLEKPFLSLKKRFLTKDKTVVAS